MAGYLLRALALVLVACLLVACGSSSRYHLRDDRPPETAVDVSGVAEPVPRYEPRSRGGNRSPYTVLGKSYTVMASADGFVEEGIASWYGKKFHGYKTSNGEIYNMYAFTAAHKHLPLPTYVRVTHLDNGRSVIVRVNDRGPFHGGRVIDLSYAAASRLGMLSTGTAPVRIENVTPSAGGAVMASAPLATGVTPQAVTAAAGPVFLQVGAYSDSQAADRVRSQVTELVNSKVFTQSVQANDFTVYRVRVGPYAQRSDTQEDLRRLRTGSFPDTLVISGP